MTISLNIKLLLRQTIYLISLIGMLFVSSSCSTAAPKLNIPAVEPPATHLNAIHPQVILVLGGGGSRGFAHAGVLKVLAENHIPIDMIIGTSAGSIVGALYADNPNAVRLEKLLLNTKRSDISDFSLLNFNKGFVSGHKLQRYLLNNMHARSFDQLSIPFIAVATDLNSATIHAFESGPIAPAVNASCAIPSYFQPVKIYGKTYVDGGIIDPIAVDVAKRFHPKLIIAVSLGYKLPQNKNQKNNTLSVIARSLEIMAMKLNNDSKSNAAIIIEPKIGQINILDDSHAAELIAAGEKATRKSIPIIKNLLSKKVTIQHNLRKTPARPDAT